MFMNTFPRAVSQQMTSASVSSVVVGPCSEVCRTGGCTRKWKPWSFKVVTAFPVTWLANSQTVSRIRSSDSVSSAPAKWLATRTAVWGSRSNTMRPSMSPVIATSAATPLRRYASCSMLRFPMDMGDCRPWARTASAALMNGWISSIFISGSRTSSIGHGAVFAEHVLDDFVQNFRFDRLLHEVTGPALQRRHDVLLVTHGRHHDNARLGMLRHDLLGRLDPFHLRHGDVHEHDVGIGAVVFGDGGHSVAGFTRHLAAESFHDPRQVFAGEDGIVHHQVADRLAVLAAF